MWFDDEINQLNFHSFISLISQLPVVATQSNKREMDLECMCCYLQIKAFKTTYYCSVYIVRKYWAGNTSYFLLSETVSVQPNVQIFALDNSSFPWGIHISSVVFQHAKSSKTQVPGLFLQQPVCVSVGAKCREEAQLSLLVQSITLEGQCTIS